MANQAWQFTSPGLMEPKDLGPNTLKPGHKQALIRIYAVAFNYRDRLVIDHNPDYPIKAQPGLVPCTDGAGIVEEVGPNSIWRKDDRVVIHTNTWLNGLDPRNFKLEGVAGAGNQDGTLRTYLVWDDERLIRAPEGLSVEEASTLFTAGVTAYRALFHGLIELQPGMTVLTQGTGGVSCYAIQIAAAAGVTVIATSSSNEKLEVARKLGAKHLINYNETPDWATEVLRVTNGKGVDIVVDVAGAGSIAQSVKSTRFGGAVVLVGMLSGHSSIIPDLVPGILFGAKTVVGQFGAGSKEMSDELARFMEKHQLHPQIAQVFEFGEADKALEAATKLTAPGKVVVRV